MAANQRISIGTILVTCWIALSIAGLWALGFFAARGQEFRGVQPDLTTEGTEVMLLFAHPHCPCFATSRVGFADIVRQSGFRGTAEIVFVRPAGVPAGWELTPSWDAAAALADIRVSCDVDGERARKVGAIASGQVVFIDADGAVRFRGGITRPGSHAGDNIGRRSLLAILTGECAEQTETPVYGCSLQ